VHTAERARNDPRSTISPPLEPPKRGAQGWSNDLSDSFLTEVRFRGEARLHALERMVLRKARPAHERVRST
jgi:hypothetical protein